MTINKALQALQTFQGESLTKTLANIESEIQGLGIEHAAKFSLSNGITDDFLEHARSIKRIAGQINVIIHAAGILRSLSSILQNNEVVESVSLGAGNTGRKFDLETNFVLLNTSS